MLWNFSPISFVTVWKAILTHFNASQYYMFQTSERLLYPQLTALSNLFHSTSWKKTFFFWHKKNIKNEKKRFALKKRNHKR